MSITGEDSPTVDFRCLGVCGSPWVRVAGGRVGVDRATSPFRICHQEYMSAWWEADEASRMQEKVVTGLDEGFYGVGNVEQ